MKFPTNNRLISFLAERSALTNRWASGEEIEWPNNTNTPFLTRTQILEGISREVKCLFCGNVNSVMWSQKDKKFCNETCMWKFRKLPKEEKLKLRENLFSSS